MISISSKNNKFITNKVEFLADTEDDIKNLQTEGIKPGSICLVISSGNIYMLNNNKQWSIFGGGE